MGNNAIIFSFIIPHKNSPDLLKQCLDSIPVRDDVQVIVVDDDSSSEVVNIKDIRNYRTGNYEVYSLQNSGGAGKARNEGLRHARGKWLFFADADDTYTEQFPVFLDKYSHVDDIDIVYFCCNGLDEFNDWIAQYAAGDKSVEKRIRYNSWVPWNKMFKADLVRKHGISFEEIKSGNDAKFSLICGYFAKIIRVETGFYYTYSPNEQGITMKKKTLNDILNAIPYKLEIINFLNYVDARYPRYERNVKPSIYLIRQYGVLGYIKYVIHFHKYNRMKPIYEEISTLLKK